MYKHLSSPLLLAILTLLGGGLVQVYSSSFIFATESFGDGLYFFSRQAMFSVLAFAVLLVTAQVPIKWIEKWGWTIWLLASLGVAMTFIPGVGVKVGGAARWIQLPLGFRFEPSEVLKFSFTILFASLIVRRENLLGKMKWWALIPLVLLPLFLLLRQPDFGSFAIIVFVGISLLFAFGLKWRYIFASLTMIIPAFYLLVMRVPYRRARVLGFLDPWSDAEQKGFQVIQSMLSFHSGGNYGRRPWAGAGKAVFFAGSSH